MGASALVLVSLALSACGGRTDENAPACENIVGCGGDLDGQWKVAEMCVGIYDGSAALTNAPECEPGVRHSLDSATVVAKDAIISFAAGNYAETGLKTIDMTLAYTEGCLLAKGFGSAAADTCQRVEEGLLSQADSPSSVTCGVEASACVCHLFGDVPFGDSGSYRIVGTQIFFNDDFDGGPFCVHGDKALVSAVSDGQKARFGLIRQP